MKTQYKYLFFNDYSEGAHPKILEALCENNCNQEIGYGHDSHSIAATALIRDVIKNTTADIHFVSGGTQANIVALNSTLKSFEAVIAVSSAHIVHHEAGAIEATGHKIIQVEHTDGKLTSKAINEIVANHNDEHMVKPKVVFVSQATELGTIYSKSELSEISQCCKQNDLYLYLDGARLGAALTSAAADLVLSEIGNLVDLFYIGGTKNGALFGEALVIINPALRNDFRRHMKQHGALLAKGRTIGIQFEELFRNNLFFEVAHHANSMAKRLAGGIEKCGFNFLTQPTTNQIFPIFPNTLIKKLNEIYGFHAWSKIDTDRSCIRLVTSWATEVGAIDEFIRDLEHPF